MLLYDGENIELHREEKQLEPHQETANHEDSLEELPTQRVDVRNYKIAHVNSI